MNSNHLTLNNQSEEHETFYSDYGFNNSSEGLQQQVDMTTHICSNCFPITGDDNLQIPYDNTTVLDQHEQRSTASVSHDQVSLTHHSPYINHNVNEQISPIMPQDLSNSKIPYSSCSAPLQQFVNEQTSQHSPIHSSKTSSHHDLHVNSSSMIELFKIEVSGIEIIARQKIDSSQNYLEMQDERSRQPQRNSQSYLVLEDHNTGRTVSRMQPYHIPVKQNQIDNRYHAGQQQYCSHFCSTMVDHQPDHLLDINRTSADKNSLIIPDTHIKQSGDTQN